MLAWRPHLHSQKWLSCSVQSLEMFSCVFSCEDETALSIIDPTSALVELNNARKQKGRKTAGLLDIAEEQLPSLEVSRMEVFLLLSLLVLMFVRIPFEMLRASFVILVQRGRELLIVIIGG